MALWHTALLYTTVHEDLTCFCIPLLAVFPRITVQVICLYIMVIQETVKSVPLNTEATNLKCC
jgi:hypothetical protein